MENDELYFYDDWTVEDQRKEDASEVVESLLGSKFGGGDFTDYDPLLIVMYRTALKIRDRDLSLTTDEGKELWIESMNQIQDGDGLEHNHDFPCWKCNTAFQPVVDEDLFKLFLGWFDGLSPDNGVKLHLCKNCGGTLKYSVSRKYEEDMHTPEPGKHADSEVWIDELLQHHWL